MAKLYRLGSAVFDPALARIERDGTTLELQPKLLAVLGILLERRDRVVTKREILAAVWPGIAVSDTSLTRAVSLLRTALGETAAEPRVIRTASRHGYRLAEVTEIERPDAPLEGAPRTHDPFVGREADLAALDAAWAAARSARGGVVVISGEAGIGKTRLANELVARISVEGARAVLGFSPASGGAPPLWPWSRALRSWAEQESPGTLETIARDARVDLALLLPEYAAGTASAPWSHAAPARFEALDQLDRLVAALAARRPLALMLDDLHAADRSSLRALELVARGAASTALLLIAIYRDGELAAEHPLHGVLAALDRDPSLVRIRVAPLAPDAADQLVATLVQSAIPPEVSSAIRTRAGGNPLFLRELVRAWAQDPAAAFEAAALPPAVSEVIRGRIERSAAGTRRALAAAAVIGADFELALLRTVARLEGNALAAALDDMTRAGWIRLVSRGPTRYGFVHPLVPETLRATTPAGEQIALHARAAEALAAEHAGRVDPVAERLAEHHFAMAIGGHPDASPAEYARLAAELAERRLAFDEAARWFERAAEALEIGPAREDAFRAEVWIGLARSRWALADFAGAAEPAERAADLARRSGRSDLAARAALVFWARGNPQGAHQTRGLALLEDAERALRGGADPLRAEVLARTAEHLAHRTAGSARAVALADEALALARASARPATLWAALYCGLFATWARLSPAERRARTDELLLLAREMGDPVSALQASPLHLTCLLEAGEIPAVDAEIARFEREIASLAVPAFFRWYGPLYRGMRAEMGGRYAEAERLALEAFGHARRAHVYDAPRAFGAQIFAIRTAQGRGAELEGAVRDALAAYPDDGSYPALHAVILAEAGRLDEARARFEPFVDAYDPTCDQNRGVTVTILATACAPLRDAARAARLYEAFAPEADLVVTNVSAWICQGSLHWPLGKLAQASGAAAAARRHYEAAARRNAEIGAIGFLALAELDHALLSAEMGEIGAARELGGAALDRATRIGNEPCRARAAELVRRLD